MAVSTQQTFEFPFNHEKQWRAIICELNGGSVTIEVWNGESWVLTDTFDDSNGNSGVLFTDGVKMRVTPTGGASYHWSESP